MEQAEHALFRDMGTSIFSADLHEMRDLDPPFTFPMRVHVERLGTKSVTYHHEMLVADEVVVRGRIIAVCSSHVQGKLTGCPIPERLRTSLSRYLMPSSESSA